MIFKRSLIFVIVCFLSLFNCERLAAGFYLNSCTKDEVTCKVNKKNKASTDKYKNTDIYCVNGKNSICCDNGLIGCPKGFKCPTGLNDTTCTFDL